MEYPSQKIKDAIDALSTLPGVGRKTALRLALHLLKQSEEDVSKLGESLISLRRDVHFCKKCHNVADSEICHICSSNRRNEAIIAVVEDTKDVLAIESTAQFNGMYHVLNGLINPLQGIGPSQLNIDSLVKRVQEGGVKEVILAFSANIEGDTTAFFLTKKLSPLDVQVSHIARGIPVGMDLEYTDEVTLARSILNRTPV